MFSIVSFDYFEPFEYLDVGFTEVGSWSVRFEWLGYESLNFIQGLGSIVIFVTLQILTILIAFLLRTTHL